MAESPPLSDALRAELERVATERAYAPGEVVLAVGALIRSVPFVVEGAVKVVRDDPDGEGELLLYYLEAGETCAATLSSFLGQQRSSVRAVAELPTRVRFVPAGTIDVWLARYPEWRRFVLASFHARFEELLAALDAVAFADLPARTLHLLRERAALHPGGQIPTTHRELAAELNSDRAVVTRVLRGLELEGQVRLARGTITVLPPRDA